MKNWMNDRTDEDGEVVGGEGEGEGMSKQCPRCDQPYEACDCYLDYNDGIDDPCWHCGGDGGGIVGVDWDGDDPINGPYDGEYERCPCCGGSGLARDCTFW